MLIQIDSFNSVHMLFCFHPCSPGGTGGHAQYQGSLISQDLSSSFKIFQVFVRSWCSTGVLLRYAGLSGRFARRFTQRPSEIASISTRKEPKAVTRWHVFGTYICYMMCMVQRERGIYIYTVMHIHAHTHRYIYIYNIYMYIYIHTHMYIYIYICS